LHSFAPLRHKILTIIIQKNFVTNFGDFSQIFKKYRQNFAIFVMICAETSLTIDHQENVGKKREKRKYGTAQEKAAGSQLRRIHLEQKRKRAKNGRREGQHYLRSLLLRDHSIFNFFSARKKK